AAMNRAATSPPVASTHPLCALVRLRAQRKTLWMRKVWAEVPEAPHPAAIMDEEVEHLLADPVATHDREQAFYRQDAEAVRLSGAIEEAERLLAADARWRRIGELFGLTRPEHHLLALALALALEPSLGRVFAYLHDQPELTQATPWLASQLFDGGGQAAVPGGDSPLQLWGLLRPSPDLPGMPDALRGWLPGAGLSAWLCSGAAPQARPLPRGCALLAREACAALPQLYPVQLESALDFAQRCAAGPQSRLESVKLELELVGPPGGGRATFAGQFGAAQGRNLLRVDEALLLAGLLEADVPGRVLEALRAAMLDELIVLWDEGDAPNPAARALLRERPGLHMVARRAALAEPAPSDVHFRSVVLPPLRRAERILLWQAISAAPVPRQVCDWLLTPGEIRKIEQIGGAGDEAIVQACHRPVESSTLLVPMALPYGAGDLVLTPSVQDQLDDFEQQVRLRWDVYEDWGFERLCPNGRGIVALFAGPSGTGKTMAVQVLARKLGVELYRLDLAQVVNKYIGETEKRLRTVFDECDRAHFMLLIDECEGMFGQRFSSKDAHDRYANLEIDYLLQRLEQFQGVAVLASNRKSDLDPAFLRRIRCLVDFLPPGPAERIRLWQSALPETSPSGETLRGEIDWQLLGDKATLTGAEIKLAALNAAFIARRAGQPIGMEHLLTSVRREFAKKGQTLRVQS
ncbi:MAG: AAA family ATPase, partial [Gammaproteobacteria bacterium]